MNQTEHLQLENWVFDIASVTTDVLVRDLCLANVAPVLDLDEVDIYDKATDLYDVPDDVVARDGLQ